MYKLIALDMDGTLLNKEKSISEENFKAIQEAKKKGIKVVLATGRPIKGVQKYLKHLNLISEEDYAIAFNGALVQKTKSGEILANTLMTIEDLHFLYDLSKKLDVNIHALTPTACITPRLNKYSEIESTMNDIPLDLVDFNNIDANTKIVKIMFVDNPDLLDEVIKKLPKDLYEKYTIVRSAPYFLEFLDKSVNKGAGVELLASTLGIKPEEVICVGDAGNDIHMIEYAGLGVAMDNAFPEVKEVANYVTKNNDEHGVAHVINKFILNKE